MGQQRVLVLASSRGKNDSPLSRSTFVSVSLKSCNVSV